MSRGPDEQGRHTFRILNVFTEGDRPFSGNPLAVVEDAGGLPEGRMQDIARQFNLSETAFITSLDRAGAGATVRFFTPSYELPFAGHPTLGTAYVVSALTGEPGEVTLRMPAGDIPVAATGTRWTLTAKPATTLPVEVADEDLAAMVGLPVESLGEQPLWVDSGVQQLILPLRTVEDVRASRADPALLRRFASSVGQEALVYVWAAAGGEEVEARLFFTQDGAAIEDPATGSACANLGGWLVANGIQGVRRRVRQGAAVSRPSLLELEVLADGTVRVGGEVRQVGEGVLTW